MAGSATFTTDPSMNAMLEPRMLTASTQGRARAAQPGVPDAPRTTPSSQGARPALTMGIVSLQFELTLLESKPKIQPLGADALLQGMCTTDLDHQ
ncbi:MAG: hypothetical protein ACLGHY_06450 [Gammaproteobacteria bacterium]